MAINCSLMALNAGLSSGFWAQVSLIIWKVNGIGISFHTFRMKLQEGGGTHIECFADLEGYYTNLETAIKGRDGIICVKSLKNPQIMISQQKTQNSHIVRFGGELSVVEKLFD